MHLRKIDAMYRLLMIFLVSIACSCKPTSKSEASASDSSFQTSDLDTVIDNKVVPFKYRSFFKVPDGTSFLFDYDDVERMGLIKIDSTQFVELFKTDKELLFYNSEPYVHYFYSFQKPQLSYQAITAVINREYESTIFYFIFSRSGELLSKFEVAGAGGDGLFSHQTHGSFVNDTTYILTTVSKEFYSDNDRKRFKLDSSATKAQIYGNGKLFAPNN